MVIPRKKRCRGTQAGSQKILIRWSSITIPCAFSALFTPATVITDIGHSGRAPIAALLKAALFPQITRWQRCSGKLPLVNKVSKLETP